MDARAYRSVSARDGRSAARALRRASVAPAETREEAILELQRTAGNTAVASLLDVQREYEQERTRVSDEPPVEQPHDSPSSEDGPRDAGREVPREQPLSDRPATAGPADPVPAEEIPKEASVPEGDAKPAKEADELEHGVRDEGKQDAQPVQPAPPKPAPPKPGPSFVRDPGCDIEAPALPTLPAPGPFKPDPTAKLPPKEVPPDLSMIPQDKPWWDDAAAKAFGEKLADCYASRGMKDGKPVDRAAKLAQLQKDFDEVVRGWFGRTGYGRWHQAPAQMATLLQGKRGRIMTAEKGADAKKPKAERRTQDEIDAAVEQQMQRARYDLVEDVRMEVAKGTWGWMAERRELLDFDTIKQSPTGKAADLAEILTDDETVAVVHQVLVDNKRELSAAEIAATHAAAQRAADAANQKAGKPITPLTDDEKAAAVAKVERQRIRDAKLGGKLQTALIKARTRKEDPNLVVPTTSDVKGWKTDSNKTRIHKDLLPLLKTLEGEFLAGFTAETYQVNIDGDHGSSDFQGRFRSLDMYPHGGPSRINKPFGELGFFDKQVAFDFALAIDRAIDGKGTHRILYNDFRVARELNKVLKNGRMSNQDNVTFDVGKPVSLNWHGPLVTHFHVDFAV